jgi:hypothetical protein
MRTCGQNLSSHENLLITFLGGLSTDSHVSDLGVQLIFIS